MSIKKGFFLVTFFVLILFLTASLAKAVSEEECQKKQKKDVNLGVECWEELLEEVGQRKATLQSEIAKFDTKIALTTAQISQTISQIEELEKEIGSLNVRIALLDSSLNELSAVLIKRIAATYKKGKIDPLALFFSSRDFGDFVTRYQYLRVIQIHDRKLLLQMETARSNYNDQKRIKEEKQERLKVLKKRLISQKELLAQQKREKEYLLEVTKNDEVRYQMLLAAARAEQAAMEAAVKRALALLKEGTPVKKGQEIALIGNTGAPYCSTGSHLHFEIRKKSEPQNPALYLKPRSDIIWDNEPDAPFAFAGDWDWPIETPRITQGFGMSYWARLGWYNGGPHTGIDMTSVNPVIKAPKEGILYKGTTTCKGVGMNFVAIDHGDDLISWYWHVQ